MSSTKLLFNADEVQRLRTKISQVSQDTNQLYLQLKGQASSWGGIPMNAHLVKAQVMINELTVEAEKLEDVIRTALKGVEGLQEANKQKTNQLTQRFSLFAGMFGSFRAQTLAGRTIIPNGAQKAASNLITSFAALPGRDELDSDPAVEKLRNIIKTTSFGSVENIAAQSKLKDIYAARDQIAKSQLAYKIYEQFGNKAQMNAVHRQAEEARQKLASLGVNEVHYEAGKDLSVYFKQPAVKACDYDPSITTSSVPLMENEVYAFLLRMSAVEGTKGDWAKQQLEQMKPQATIGAYDPHDFVSDEEILNRDDPEVKERLSETYWHTLSLEEQDRRFAEIQADYKKQNKAIADRNRLLGSGVGNQVVANILVGGSNMMVHAIDRISLGLAGTVTNWIMGPDPEGYVNPMDDPYGKKAGIIIGEVGSWLLPFKLLKEVKTVGVLGKVSSTAWRSAISGAVSGIVEEVADSINDFREDGKQSVGERITAVGINTGIAGVGDIAIKAGGKVLASAVRFVRGKLPDINFGKVEEAVKAIDEVEVKTQELSNSHIVGSGNFINELLKKSKCSADELTAYLKKMDEYSGTKYADEYASAGKWPDEIQIPKDSNVLNADGSIKWSEVPNGGYVLDQEGNAIKEVLVPKTGNIIDRYGPPNGRYTSPVPEGKPYNYDQRSLPYVEDVTKYHQYEVIGDFNNIQNYIQQCPDVKVRLKAEAYMKKFKLSFDDLKVQEGYIAEGFGSSGGGIQFELPLPVTMLEDLGLLLKVN